MELNVKGSFDRDVFSFTNTALLNEVYKAIKNVQNAKTIAQINQLKKLEKYSVHYRIKIAGDYRIGVVIRKNKVWFVRFGHRNSFYAKFP
ncbi:MAG: type II toxin-antitoxin system RelE/ParE family toxin [Bacteroidia bacterium]